jgi:hypothetical protein
LVSGAGIFGTSVIALGDSMQHRINHINTISSLSRSGGVATASITGHSFGSGMPADINNAQDNTFNLKGVTVTRVDANTITYPCPGADGSTSAIAGRSMLTTVLHSFSDDGYWTWLNLKLNGALTLARNAGISSNQATDVLARLTSDVLAYSSDWVFWQPTLYNDTVNAGYTTAQLIGTSADSYSSGYYSQTLAALIASGRRILLVGPPAMSSGLTTARVQTYLAVMKWMERMAQTYPKVWYADVWRYSVNAVAGTPGTALSGLLASDNIHESARGAERKAQAIYDAIGGLIPRISRLTSGNADNYGVDSSNDNILDYGPWTNSGGTVNAATGGGSASGTIPGGWQGDAVATTGGSVVWSAPARSDGVGYNIQAVVTPAANNDYARARLVTAVSSSRFTAGQKVRLVLDMAVSGVAGSTYRGANILVIFNGGASTTAYAMSSNASAATSAIQSDFSGSVISPDITIPSDSITSIDVRVQWLFGGSASAASIAARAWRR